MKKSALIVALAALVTGLAHAQMPAPAAKPAAAPMTAPAAVPVAPAAATPAAKPAASPTAPAAGGSPDKVWTNDASKVYHCFGSKYYGKTKKGEYMSEADAKAKGFHGVGGKACAK